MSSFVLIHGAGDGGWSWHLVKAELEARGHEVIAPDLPADDDSLTVMDYADSVVEAVGDRDHVVVVGHSFGGFTAPIVAERLSADVLILLAAMIPVPGESPADWWGNTFYNSAVQEQAARDGGLTGSNDLAISFYHDVPRALAQEAMGRERAHPSAAAFDEIWPMSHWPDISTRFILCRDDRFFPADFFRKLIPERLGIEPEEIDGSHCVMLSDPVGLADVLLNTPKTTTRN